MKTILEIANEGFPGGLIASHFHLKTGKKIKNPARIDTLASFVGQELVETVGLKPTGTSIETAVGLLTTAITDIQKTIDALDKWGADHGTI